jgi:hypothetical protein
VIIPTSYALTKEKKKVEKLTLLHPPIINNPYILEADYSTFRI